MCRINFSTNLKYYCKLLSPLYHSVTPLVLYIWWDEKSIHKIKVTIKYRINDGLETSRVSIPSPCSKAFTKPSSVSCHCVFCWKGLLVACRGHTLVHTQINCLGKSEIFPVLPELVEPVFYAFTRSWKMMKSGDTFVSWFRPRESNPVRLTIGTSITDCAKLPSNYMAI